MASNLTNYPINIAITPDTIIKMSMSVCQNSIRTYAIYRDTANNGSK